MLGRKSSKDNLKLHSKHTKSTSKMNKDMPSLSLKKRMILSPDPGQLQRANLKKFKVKTKATRDVLKTLKR
jgi:hypothetical protein